jgi:hypothetical protein
MGSPWFIPDAKQWGREEDYDPAVAEAQNCVTRKLAQDGGMESAIFNCVSPVICASMSKNQRLRLLYVVCLCMAAEDPPGAALPHMREAIALAKELGEDRARSDLLIQRAYVNRYVTQIPDAIDTLRECLEAFEELQRRREWTQEDTTRALTVSVRLATLEFIVEEVAASQELYQKMTHCCRIEVWQDASSFRRH